MDNDAESFDLRWMIADECEYYGYPNAVIDEAIREIKRSDRLLEMLDAIVDEAIFCTASYRAYLSQKNE